MSRPPLSMQAGLVRDPDGALRRSYRALQPLSCARCASAIPTGALFTRRAILRPTPYLPHALPHCATCCPFDVLPPTDQRPATGPRP